MACRLASLLFLLTLAAPSALRAQVRASAAEPLTLSAYYSQSGALGEQGYGKATGYTAGMIVSHSRWLALDDRGVILRERIPLHTYLAETGPRITHRWRSLQAYGSGMAGYAHSGYRYLPNTSLHSGFGFVFTAAGGADLRLTHRFDWRVADVSWNHIMVGPGVTPVIVSTGVVFHIFEPGWSSGVVR